MTVVIDASVLTAALIDVGPAGRWSESAIESDFISAPELVLVETTNVLRRLERAKRISAFEAASAFRDLLRLDLELYPFGPFAARTWALRDNFTSYDAWYVALAEALECPLATLDRKLARASGAACRFLTPQ